MSAAAPADATRRTPIDPTARASAYALLADLFRHGPRGAAREAAVASPLLADALARYERSDDLEADHEEAFGFQVFPIAGVFLDATGRAGAGAGALSAQYAALGMAEAVEVSGIDHLATLLDALARANAAEASPMRRSWTRAQSRSFLDQHLLTWLPTWASAVRRLELPWPTALADQVLELTLLQRAEAGGEPTARFAELPALPDLDGRDTDLAAIAKALTCAARAGLFLSRKDLARLARRSRTPTGFGSRSQLLLTALREGAHLETLIPLLRELAKLYRAWLGEVSELEQGPMRAFTALLAPWKQRAEEVFALIDRLERSASGELA